MGKTWMPKTAGILGIIAGAFGVLSIAGFYALATVLHFMAPSKEAPQWVLIIILALLIIRLLIDILAIVGGVFCIRKKAWGLSLAGSIAAALSSWVLGIPALIFVIMGKNQFK